MITLNEFFVYLIQTRPFYGRLAIGLERHATTRIPTMAVGLREGRVAFYYNPEFLALLDFKTASFVLEHELLHLLLDHIPRFMELLSIQPTDVERAKAHAVANIAMDCAIHALEGMRKHPGFEPVQQLILDDIKRRHPDAPEDPRNGLQLHEKYDLPPDGSFELYQYLLMRKVEVMEICLRIQGGITHELWGQDGDGEGDEGDDEGDSDGTSGDGQSDKKGKGKGKGKNGKKGDNKLAFEGIDQMTSDELMSQANRVREQIKNTLRQVIKNMGGIGRGTLPGAVEEFLKAYLEDPVIPWWEIFATRARMSRPSKHQRSCVQPNRTLMALSEEDARIIPMPGRTRDRSWRIILMIDTSGSMSTRSLEIVFNELEGMVNVDEGTEVRVIQGDCAIQHDAVYKKGDKIPREVYGRGGTDFNVYFQYMRKLAGEDDKSPDLVVVYTDGYAPEITEENRLPSEIPIIWLVTPQHSSSFAGEYGEFIVCDPDHNERYEEAA